MGLNEDNSKVEKDFAVANDRYVSTKVDPETFVTIMKVTNEKKEVQIINSFSATVTEAYDKLIQAQQIYTARGVNPEVIGTYKKINFNVGYNI